MSESTPSASSSLSRLQELARDGAVQQHRNAIQGDCGTVTGHHWKRGPAPDYDHTYGFVRCSHPDCVLVHEPLAALAAPAIKALETLFRQRGRDADRQATDLRRLQVRDRYSAADSTALQREHARFFEQAHTWYHAADSLAELARNITFPAVDL